MRIDVLGPLAVVLNGAEVEVRAPTQRRALLYLVLHVNEVVSSDRLADAVWPDRHPTHPQHATHSLVHRLRHLLGGSDGAPGPVRRHDPGYVLTVDRQDIDAHRFCALVSRAEAELPTSPHAARRSLSEALGLWRGDAFLDVAYDSWATAEISRLTEHRVSACESLARLNLDLGQGHLAIADLQSLTEQHPLRESLWVLLWEALAQAGRHLEIAASYQHAVTLLATEYGVTPTRHLQESGVQLGGPVLEPGTRSPRT